ncbi:putative transcriptional regulatory protein [Escovopsis weberi]|uniref:Putative transcriptional regulatory protein n=1 Tax=Escovopsis weberi TaxID=150374 RepID=A0A0M8N3G0_ESCWE|nr:putative transcriptional regulatory protein [Escovopsis weberi]
MEQIETQASDLRYLARAPVALSDLPSAYDDDMSQHRPQQHASSSSAEYGDNSALGGDEAVGGANKRKSVDQPGGAKQTRSKRNRIKCNGETPCQRCGNLNLACLYAPNCCSNSFKDSDDFRMIMAQLGRLQDEVGRLNQTVRALQSETRLPPPPPSEGVGVTPGAASGVTPGAASGVTPGAASGVTPGAASGVTPGAASSVAPSLPPSTVSGPSQDPPSSKGAFKGSTSAAYCLDVANATISRMGWPASDEADEPEALPVPTPLSVPPAPGGDPLLEYDEGEMIRLCQVHADELEILHPVISTQDIMTYVRSLTPYLDGLRQQRSSELINDDKTLQLKIILCCALIVENHGQSDKADRLYESMDAVINRKLMVEPADITSLPFLATAAGYRFLACDALLAWRAMGQVIRLCVELGIHQRRGLDEIQNDFDRRSALNSFWVAYILDRRWAFETGLPFTIHDDDIDPQLPMPDDAPYLVAMIKFSRLSAKVWRQVSHFGHVLARELRGEEIDRLDREIYAWYDSVPEDLKMRDWREIEGQEAAPVRASQRQQRLQIWTYLRSNQIRIWLYIPILHSATSIMSNPDQAQRVVDLAKDTIQFLTHLDKTASFYRKLYFHQFLASSIAAVFLACAHAPVRFASTCRAEFYMALDLVTDMSRKSVVSQRLWRAVRALKKIAPRIGLNPEDPQSTAALGMIGLARGHMDPAPVNSSSNHNNHNHNSNNSNDDNNAATYLNHHHHHHHHHHGGGGGGSDLPMPLTHPHGPPPSSSDKNANLGAEFSRIFETYVGMNGIMHVGGTGTDSSVANSHTDVSTPTSHSGAYFQPGDAIFYSFMREMM